MNFLLFSYGLVQCGAAAVESCSTKFATPFSKSSPGTLTGQTLDGRTFCDGGEELNTEAECTGAACNKSECCRITCGSQRLTYSSSCDPKRGRVAGRPTGKHPNSKADGVVLTPRDVNTIPGFGQFKDEYQTKCCESDGNDTWVKLTSTGTDSFVEENTWKKCIFPFIIDGKEYSTCTTNKLNDPFSRADKLWPPRMLSHWNGVSVCRTPRSRSRNKTIR